MNIDPVTLAVVGDVGISALRAEGDWSGAFNDQYNDGRPTWGVGVVASMSLERRAAKARLHRSATLQQTRSGPKGGAATRRRSQAGADHGFTIDEAEVIYWGVCPDCRATGADAT